MRFSFIEIEQSGQDRVTYGEQLLSNLAADLAADLKRRGLKGLGISMLKNCRQFYPALPPHSPITVWRIRGDSRQTRNRPISDWRIRPGLPAVPPEHLLRLSWTHFIELIRIDDPLKRAFYEVDVFKETGRTANSSARLDLS